VSVILFLKPSSLDSLINPEIPVKYLYRKSRLDLRAIKKLKSYVKDADILHVHSRYNLRYLMVAKYIGGLFRPKIVFHEHVPVLSIDVFTKFLFTQVDAYIAVLQSMCEWAKQQNVAASKVYYLPNIVTAPSIPITYSSSDKKRIIMVGNIWKFKNQVFAIELLKVLPNNYTLDIYGIVNDEQYYEEIKDAIVNDNLTTRVKIIHGVNNIYSVIGNYDFAIHTSTHETGPLVLLEYMQAQLPFLAYKTGDVALSIASELPDFIINTFSVNDWATRIETVMNNKDGLNNARQIMKCIIEKKYSKENYTKQLLDIYKAVIPKAEKEN
jgi:glycosyltransferase involved in cell wall biosynthesis